MKYLIIFLLLFSIHLACTNDENVEEGFVKVEGGKVWYKIVGVDKKETPILLLHGGPGFPSDYLKPLQALASERPVIFYDQLGCGRSEKPEDTTLWKLNRFVDELALLRSELNLNRIHLYAHSWGTMLAAEYLATEPKGIQSVVFASPIFSTKDHLKKVNEIKLSLPASVRDTLLFHERNGTINSEGYQNAYNEFIKLHWCRTNPFPDEINESSAGSGDTVFRTMWGKYEFFCPGNLKNFERNAVLNEIKMPTLFTCGRFDLVPPESLSAHAEKVNGSEMLVFEKSAHMPLNEEPELYVKVVRDFVNKGER